MKKGNRSLGIRIGALVIALWLVLMVLLTWAVAQDFQNQIYSGALNLLRAQAADREETEETTPGAESLMQIGQLGYPYIDLRPSALLPVVLEQTPGSYSSNDWFWDEWELLYGFQAVTVFYDEAGEPMLKSGNLLTMHYITEENWDGKNRAHQGVAYIDLDQLPQGTDLGMIRVRGDRPWADHPSNFADWVLRASGHFEGDQFVPVSLDIAPVLNGTLLEWENRLTLEAPADTSLVTVYAWETGGISFHHTPVSVDGKAYASLVDFALDSEKPRSSGNLLQYVFTLSGKAPGKTGAARYQLTVLTKPVGYAVLRMIPLYSVSALMIGVCLWLLLRDIRKNLTRPLENLAWCTERRIPIEPSSGWVEVCQAEVLLKQSQDQVHTLQNDIQQLTAALDYAKNAEEHRRQLISDITHELKTPLAVIHGYAEGLQAGIAAEKRDYYLATILEETEKMDAMVLEMLDMSRLEAGKVRLNADHFSLLALSREIMNKLAPEETRVHSIGFSYSNDCMVTADEGRIAQVVTNLMSNALKYTPEGGDILVQVYAHDGSAHFQITNTARHLPEEVLEKLFDSFYRVDEARSNKGTGLGLPIARSIIQLHRGTLTARNATVKGEDCLVFAFEIPLQ